MPKSNFPNQIDTSVEIPTVRDNITEIGSDVFNSLKSAIIAVEKTLGVNPQGATGNTVSSRISRSLDESGNILPEALTQAGVISGPITNNEVSDFAAIKERKLDLNFPTQLLQDEISMLQSDIETFSTQIAELGAKLTAHISPTAVDRHGALAITVTGTPSSPNDISILDLESGDLQNTLEALYNRHINYSGANISATNNSHFAAQVFFDKSDVEDLIKTDSVQGAIEDLANIQGVGLRDSLLNLHSNGIVRRGTVTDPFEGNVPRSKKLVDLSNVSYTQAEGSSRTTFIFSSNPTPLDTINPFDILVLSGSTIEEDNGDYQIASVTLAGSTLAFVEVYGGPGGDDSGAINAEIYQNPYKIYNPLGYASTVRPRFNKTNTPDVQIANPNAAFILSSGIIPEGITATNHTFDITIDGGSPITIETFDMNVINQSIDSIVNKINEQAIEQRLNFMAYKYRANNCYELGLAHNIPNVSGDLINRTLEISAGSSDDGTGTLGLTAVLNTEFEGSGENPIFLNGELKSLFGNIKVLTASDIELVTGTSTLSLFDTTFAELDIRVGDLIIIQGSSDSNDDGSYRISSTLDDSATVDGSYTFSGNLDAGQIYALRVSAPIGELTFSEISSSIGSILFDVFIDENLDVFYKKRMEIDGEARSGAFIAAVVDVSRNFFLEGQTGSLSILSNGNARLFGPDGLPGEFVYVGHPGDYRIFAADGFSFITLRVGTEGTPSVDLSLDIYGFNEISRNNYLITRGVFSTSLGRVLGYPAESGVPALIDKRKTGTVDEGIISESVLEKYIQGPRNDLKGDGVIRGLRVSNIQIFSGYQTFDVAAGVALVNGIRREYPGKLNNRINTEEDFYVALDSDGCLVTGTSVLFPDGYTIDGQSRLSPFYDSTVVHLAYSEDQEVIDLRLFINDIDFKLTKELIVSNDISLGHFTQISSAVAYAKRFSEIFPEAGTPIIQIREGLFEVEEPIIIDFDLQIRGAGPSTIIRKSGGLINGSPLIGGNPSPLECVFYIGNIFSNLSDEIIHGVSISALTYESPEEYENVGSFITLAEVRGASDLPMRKFEFRNIMMQGPESILYNGGADADVIGEYFIIVGFADIATYIPSSGQYGNLTISNCIYRRAGIEFGPCHLRDIVGNSFRNVIASGNIGRALSPTEGINTFEVFEVPVNANLLNFIEVNNIS